ncbi:patatin-like phospholipase family protein [Streptomyces argyrophyllae]|uniref:Patatin-like phospholipase family protein n=1 Tax=Streptomyces argyrophylli TaxID=2726118 RepID=A0A6M4PCD2_9ACTN|nr:patatin-like phospholipase family protein [Streptomyces argyrophyllae]QJS08651.1 patatin-like phospholipase family protein [Streptomyces argyrophyllae]
MRHEADEDASRVPQAPPRDEGPGTLSPVRACALAVVAVAVAGAGLWIRHLAPTVDDVGLQLAGGARAAHTVVGDRTADFRTALTADFVLIGAYTAGTVLVFWLSSRTIAVRMRHRCLVVYGIGAAVAACVCAVTEKLLLLHGLGGADWAFAWAAGFATVKWLLLVLTVPVAAVLAVLVLKRAALHGRARSRFDRERARRRPCVCGNGHLGDTTHSGPDVVPPWPVMVWGRTRWPGAARGDSSRTGETRPRETRWENGSRVPPGREQGGLGFCVSGGGIRSACVTLGALQALRPQLRRARYLVSVSGGGYTAGALQLALAGSDRRGGSDRYRTRTRDVFMPGTPEEDHTRRHSKYVAEGTGQWLAAVGTVLRGLLASLGLLTAALLVLGLALSWGYHLVPLADPDRLPGFRAPALWAVLALLCGAAVFWFLWLVSLFLAVPFLSGVLKKAFLTFVVAGLLLAVVVVILPALEWATARLWTLHGPGTAVSGGVVGLLTYLTVLAGTGWRRVESTERTVRSAKRARLVRAVPIVGRYLMVWVVLTVVAVASLLVLGGAIHAGRTWPVAVQIGLPVVLCTVALSLDQTWTSLHPFYRARLATAFAVRRETDEDGEQLAVPYDFDEPTPLACYGRRHSGFPQVVFAAAANLSGDDRTPPGRHAVSFTLSYDYVGGPDVGYARTDVLWERVGPVIRKDLTVESAVAVSGAAFASAMGRQARAFQTLFALSNARLGTWLPNPGVLGALWDEHADWGLPPMPGIRRLPYLLREVCGRYPLDDRMLLVTDGGHYENLGLVELLRHGVDTAVCVDASGGSGAFAPALGEAMALAKEELGVEIRIAREDWQKLVPGSAPPLTPQPPQPPQPGQPAQAPPPNPLAALDLRLSADAVVVGEIVYPRPRVDEHGRRLGTKGQLIVARATLTPDMPYALLAYAQANHAFPHDGTSDQWFDSRRFDAYQALGHWIGERVAKLLPAESCPPRPGYGGDGSPRARRPAGTGA